MAHVDRADRVEAFTVTVAAGVTEASAQFVDVDYPDAEVLGVEFIIPDGHLGLTGIALAIAGQQVIPATAGAFIVGNDEKIEWPLGNLPTTGAMQARVYNEDVFEHSFHLRFLLAELPAPGATAGRLVEPLAL